MIVLGYALAVLVGVSLGLLGGGGAILTVPILVYILGVGMREAVPMSLIVVGITSVVGMLQHHQARNVSLRAVVSFGPAAMLGSVGGSALAMRVSERLQLAVFGAVLVAAALGMLRSGPAAADKPHGHKPIPVLAGIGAGVGMLTGLIGVGGGFLYVPALSVLGGLQMRRAVGTSLALITLSCLAGLMGYAWRVRIDWQVVGLFTALALVGVRVGAALVPRVGQATLRRGFAVFILVMGVLVLIRR